MYEAVLDHPGDYICQAQAQISLILTFLKSNKLKDGEGINSQLYLEDV